MTQFGAFNVSDIPGLLANNQGTQIYGSIVFSGNSNGTVELFDINTGFPLNQANPAPGEFVPNARKSTIGVYNPEGQRIIPLIADGILYGYGGNNKWNNLHLIMLKVVTLQRYLCGHLTASKNINQYKIKTQLNN